MGKGDGTGRVVAPAGDNSPPLSLWNPSEGQGKARVNVREDGNDFLSA
jgi:hypothetical protein